jgi:hypothetical protein
VKIDIYRDAKLIAQGITEESPEFEELFVAGTHGYVYDERDVLVGTVVGSAGQMRFAAADFFRRRVQ